MVVFPNCKVNLGLHIIGKRKDGYHNLETIFYPLPWNDVLEILPLTLQIQQAITSSPKTIKITHQTDDILFVQSGLNIEGDAVHNLCVKAFYLLKQHFPALPPVFMYLHKVLPTQAGLGGGSADAAFTLKTIATIFNLSIADNELEKLALTLGSDCPFFIQHQPCIATGRGEQMQPISLNLHHYTWVLVNPNIHISTAWAFAQIKPVETNASLQHIIQQPIETWRDTLYNDFEKPVYRHFPAIQQIKEALYNKGALYASLSGSGSTVYGIFPADMQYNFSFPSSYTIKFLQKK